MRIAQSSNIQAHDYDPISRTLTIQFVSGAVYQYHGFKQSDYHNFSQAGSPGSYFASKIKNQYPARLVVAGPQGSRRRR